MTDSLRPHVHGILQVRILEWVVLPFSRGLSQPRDRTRVSHIAGGFFTSWDTREARPKFKYWTNGIYIALYWFGMHKSGNSRGEVGLTFLINTPSGHCRICTSCSHKLTLCQGWAPRKTLPSQEILQCSSYLKLNRQMSYYIIRGNQP